MTHQFSNKTQHSLLAVLLAVMLGTTLMTASFATQALAQDQIRLGDLTPRRDFTYVTDTVNGFLKAAASDRALGQVINVGSGSEITIGDLAQTIIQLVGRPVEIVADAQRLRPAQSEVRRLLADNSKAEKLLDWSPLVSLEEGLSRTPSYQ